LSSGIIEELYRVSNYAKIPKGIDLDEFLSSIKFEYKHTTKQQVDENIKIRDIKDKRILSDALLA
jgi:predicted nucleic acid-binding protein